MQATRILVGMAVVLLAAGCRGDGTGDNQPHGGSIGANASAFGSYVCFLIDSAVGS